MRRYAAYQSTGLDWLGELPAHWRVKPLWSMYRRVKDKDHPDERMLSVFRDYGVIAKDSRENLNVTAENRSIYQLVHPGWLVTNRMKAWQGSVGISSLRGIVSGHYICFAPLHNEHDPYLNWLFRSPRYTHAYGLISRGVRVGQAEISNDDYQTLPVVLPPIDEQRRIADYLDQQTCQLDDLVSQQLSLIDHLLERRRAVVDAVVTKGLNRSVALTDSGSDWLGELPAHWRVKPLWSMYRRVKDKDHPDERMLSVFRDYGVIAKDSRENLNVTAENRSIYQLVHPGWLVTNRMKAWQGSVGISSLRGIVSGHYICFAPLHNEHDPYLNWLFRSPRYTHTYGLISRGVRVGQAEISNDDYQTLPVVLPPIDEQRRIADYLDQQMSTIDAMINDAERFVEVANQRRAAVVAAAITGQIDVREAA